MSWSAEFFVTIIPIKPLRDNKSPKEDIDALHFFPLEFCNFLNYLSLLCIENINLFFLAAPFSARSVLIFITK